MIYYIVPDVAYKTFYSVGGVHIFLSVQSLVSSESTDEDTVLSNLCHLLIGSDSVIYVKFYFFLSVSLC